MTRPLTKNYQTITAILIASLLLIFTFVGTLSAQDLVTEDSKVEVLPPDVTISKSTDSATANVEDTVGYTIVLTNEGTDVALNVKLLDTLPAEVDYVAGSLAVSSDNVTTLVNADVTADALTWEGIIGISGAITIEIDTTILSTVTIGTLITNTAQAIDVNGLVTASASTEVVDIPPADLDITKSADVTEASEGDIIQYTVLVESNGPGAASDVDIMDTLPATVSYIAGSLSETLTNSTALTAGAISGGVLTWNGIVGNGGSVELVFDVEVLESAVIGTDITNEASVEWNGMTETGSVDVEVIEDTSRLVWYLPYIATALNTPSGVMASRPVPVAGNNAAWTVMWGGASNDVTYEIQESKNSDFSGSTTIYTSSSTNQGITQAPSPFNEFYYRVRAVSGTSASPWSETIVVVGAYRDDFNNDNTGWEKVRVSFLEEVYDFYETQDSWFVLQVEDRWDWGIASPLKKAPLPPYVIEFRSEPANIGNLLSHGAVFSGDYTGNECIVPGTVEGAYQRTECFNHFYNTNLILRGDSSEQKLLFERVDELAWCPECGGAAVKRLTTDLGSDGLPNWPEVGVVQNLDEGFNTFRIEVLPNTAKVYANGQFILEYQQTNPYYNDRYFGVFASTDEYNNSTWRFDYYQVMPMNE